MDRKDQIAAAVSEGGGGDEGACDGGREDREKWN